MSSSCRTAPRGRRFLTVALLGAGILGAAAPLASAATADHLILSEVVVTANRFGAKYVEIVNPTAVSVSMDGVALTNGTNVNNGTGYWNIAGPAPTSLNTGGGTGGAFHGAFPAGFTLDPGDTIVVAVTGSADYLAAYGVLPDFELFEDALAPDGVPELVEVFPGSVAAGLGGGANAPELNDVAGSVMLYRWDGTSDLVEDLDYFHWGTNDAFRVDKTGVTVGSSTYLDDTGAATQQTLRLTDVAGDNFSYVRKSADEGTETITGGNGATGHDETSENLSGTWEVDAQSPPAPPSAHHPAAPIVTGFTVLPAGTPAEQNVTVGVTAVTPGTITSLTVHYAVDDGAESTVAGSDQGGGSWSAVVPAQDEGAVVTWWAEIVDSGGGTAVYPAGAPRFTEDWTTGPVQEPGSGPVKLLLTEVCTLGNNQEFVEIHNPSGQDVDLSNYYLTDAIFSPNDTGYWNLGGGVLNADTVGGGEFTDFHARFPDGYTIAAGDTIVVAIQGSSGFGESYEFLPDLELFEDDAISDAVPDMRWIFGDASSNSIVGGSSPTLTNSAEPIILYYHEPGADLVVDIDIFLWRSSTSTSFMFSKTGKSVGGSTYAPDTAVGSQRPHPNALEFGFSYQRVLGETGNQTMTGSNGVDGADETSENWAVTFSDANAADPSRPGGGGGTGGGGSVQLVVPARTFLPREGEVFPVRFVGKPNSETRVRVYDLEGRHVVTLFDSRFDGNPSTIPDVFSIVAWDGRDDRFELMKAGMYIVHLSVVDLETGDEDTETAPVVLATRLSR